MLQTQLDADLTERLKDPILDGLGVRQRRRPSDILDPEQMKQDRAVLIGFHPKLLQAGADLFGDRLGAVALDDPAIAAQQVEHQQVRDCGAVGNTPSLDPSHSSAVEVPAKFREKPRLADAGLADDADGLAATVFDLREKIVQDR